ncbi:hypothetical protein C0Q70_12762 [Pomacea canaliculata]|uniref:Uncharacterized protein n=1 Tax=Pomacea canaliculata TaxID=400727 RepID=A0A2T7P2G2_POMCA|nr:hypothetical protein C0Q70_12762 [Pomacea canaliculata]
MYILLWAWLLWKGAWCASPEPGVASSGYVGIGYNLLTANPEGGEQSQGGADPGLLLTRQVLDVSDPRPYSSSTATTASSSAQSPCSTGPGRTSKNCRQT